MKQSEDRGEMAAKGVAGDVNVFAGSQYPTANELFVEHLETCDLSEGIAEGNDFFVGPFVTHVVDTVGKFGAAYRERLGISNRVEENRGGEPESVVGLMGNDVVAIKELGRCIFGRKPRI